MGKLVKRIRTHVTISAEGTEIMSSISSDRSLKQGKFYFLCNAIADDFSKVLVYKTKKGKISISGVSKFCVQGLNLSYSFPRGTDITDLNIVRLKEIQKSLGRLKFYADDLFIGLIERLNDMIAILIDDVVLGKNSIMDLEYPYYLFKEVAINFREAAKCNGIELYVSFNNVHDCLYEIISSMR